jgi:hypothetical protein
MTQQRADELANALAAEFGGEAEAEQVAPGRFRFGVISPKFVGVSPLVRQDHAWLVVNRILSREEKLDISLILTFSPDDVQVA